MKKELEIWSSATFNQIVPPFWKSEPVNEEYLHVCLNWCTNILSLHKYTKSGKITHSSVSTTQNGDLKG